MRLLLNLCVISLGLVAAQDPFSGVWKLNLSKSTLPQPAPQSQTVSMNVDRQSIRIYEELVSETGERLTVTVDARFDGKDYPVIGTPRADTVAYQRVNSRTIKGVARKSGKVVSTETAVISKDGGTMRVTYSSTDERGKRAGGVGVFDKQ